MTSAASLPSSWQLNQIIGGRTLAVGELGPELHHQILRAQELQELHQLTVPRMQFLTDYFLPPSLSLGGREALLPSVSPFSPLLRPLPLSPFYFSFSGSSFILTCIKKKKLNYPHTPFSFFFFFCIKKQVFSWEDSRP